MLTVKKNNVCVQELNSDDRESNNALTDKYVLFPCFYFISAKQYKKFTKKYDYASKGLFSLRQPKYILKLLSYYSKIIYVFDTPLH